VAGVTNPGRNCSKEQKQTDKIESYETTNQNRHDTAPATL
jgi:hypothetical protein